MKNWAKIGGFCGFCIGLATVPLVPTLSTAAKLMVLSAAPVIGAVGISTSIGAFLGASIAKKR
ncbi:MAG: hypothetical protein V3S46_08615 [Nitrospinota bacterium]